MDATSSSLGSSSNSTPIGLTSWSQMIEHDDGSRSEEAHSFPVYGCEVSQPLPPYEDYTHVDHTMFFFKGGDPFETLHHIPYGNDPKFPAEEYEEYFEKRPELKDPDCKFLCRKGDSYGGIEHVRSQSRSSRLKRLLD